jgi:hypothetical protein
LDQNHPKNNIGLNGSRVAMVVRDPLRRGRQRFRSVSMPTQGVGTQTSILPDKWYHAALDSKSKKGVKKGLHTKKE